MGCLYGDIRSTPAVLRQLMDAKKRPGRLRALTRRLVELHWRRQYRDRKLGGSTGETGRARALQIAKEQYKAEVRQTDAEIESGRKPMTLGRASELSVSEVVSGKARRSAGHTGTGLDRKHSW